MFTERARGEGEVVLRFGGRAMRRDEVTDFTHVLQVGPDAFLGPSGELDDYVNHSCDPNCTLVHGPDGVALVTIAPVAAGAELTFDYSTHMQDEPSLPRCLCGAASCRGRIDSFPRLALRHRRALARRGLLAPFIRQAVGGVSRRGVEAR